MNEINEDVHFLSKVRGWSKISCSKQESNTIRACVDGKSVYIAENPPDDFVDVLEIAVADFFLPNVRKLLLILVTSPISFSDVS